MVAGIWACMYSLGEVIGPAMGGFLLQYYGFPFTSTVMASITFVLVSLFTCTGIIINIGRKIILHENMTLSSL